MNDMGGDLNPVELEATLLPGGKRPGEMTTAEYDAMMEKVDALIEKHGQERVSAALRELADLIGTQALAMLRHEGLVSEIQPLTEQHKRRAADAMRSDDDDT